MLPGITPALSGSPFVGGNDSFTKLLMHFDGTDGSTVMPDSSPSARGNAIIAGNAQLDTAQSKFGGASGLFDGSGDALGYATSADWTLGTSDFTIDWWERRSVVGANRPIISRNSTTTYVPFLVWSDATNVLFHSSSNGSSWNVANGVIMGAQDLNVWNHFAVSRQGSNFYTFKNGILTNTFSNAASLPAGSANLAICSALSGYYYAGHLDELRFSKGIARWTSNFQPWPVPYS